jgi:Ca2+-binding RTX toxin-like protein
VYTVTVTVVEEDGVGASGSSTFQVTVGNVAATLEPDPLDSTQTALFVRGSPGNDVILISRVGNQGDVEVTINGVSHGTFRPTSRIIVFGRAGDDDLQVGGSVTLAAWLHGGEGNDSLKGGGGNDVLLGEEGHDDLIGGQGRDLLIGGAGGDRLDGGPDDDILIAGYTDHDAADAALATIMAEWTSAHSYSQRVNNLRDGSGSPDRLNESYFLSTSTVHDDAIENMLTGAADQDLFFANLVGGVLDRITDKKPGETAFDEE